MEDKKVLEVVDIYSQYFETWGITRVKYPHNKPIYSCNRNDVLAHCCSMLSGIEEFISRGNQDKKDQALVRLGFVQGCLWTEGDYTVKDFKGHNCPDEGTVDDQTHELLSQEDLEDWEYG